MYFISKLLTVIVFSYGILGFQLTDCGFNGSGGATNAMIYYKCLTNFVYFYALNLPFEQSVRCIWNNQAYANQNKYKDIHLTTVKSFYGDIHVTFVNVSTFHCYASDKNCVLNANSDAECMDATTKKIFSNVCNSFFVSCETTPQEEIIERNAKLKEEESKMENKAKEFVKEIL